MLDSYTGFINPTKESFIDQRKYRFKDKKNIIIERGDAKDFRLIYKILDELVNLLKTDGYKNIKEVIGKDIWIKLKAS